MKAVNVCRDSLSCLGGAAVVLFTSSDLNGPHRALTDLTGPHLTSSETGLSPHRTLCHPIGMLLNRDVYDTSVPVPQPQYYEVITVR